MEALALVSPPSSSSSLPDEGVMRLASPGEFTRRAFENGYDMDHPSDITLTRHHDFPIFLCSKLDLTQVEGLADLLAAETEEQR